MIYPQTSPGALAERLCMTADETRMLARILEGVAENGTDEMRYTAGVLLGRIAVYLMEEEA